MPFSGEVTVLFRENLRESLRESRKKELKDEIYMQALKMFKDRGYENVTVEEITTACGIAKGTFYNYFPRKEHILLHVGQEQMELFKASIARHANVSDFRERLKLMFEDLIARIDKEPDLLKITIVEILRSSLLEQELQLLENFKLCLTPLFEDAMDRGQVSARWSAYQLSSVLVGMYYHTLFAWLSKPDKADMLSIFYSHFDMFWDGVEIREEQNHG
ncbi:MAG: TetR/AcrR family transcriptional regulator [Bacillota bacterium]